MTSNVALRVGMRICILALVADLLPIGVGLSEERAPEARVSDRAVGAGRWQSQRDNLGNRDWHVQIQRFDDDSIEGSLIVIGSPTLHKVRLEGRVDGDEVYGVLVGDSKQQVGTFTGSVFEAGVSGTYTTADGDSGSWSWAGPAGARSLKERGEKDIAESTP